MKIKRAPKKTPSTNPSIAAFILQLVSSPPDELPSLLQPIVSAGWAWPRTDLQHWIVPLNRFDAILEEVISDYDLGSMEHCQTNAFTPRTKELVAAILAFEKVLLENSTNRKIFSSFDRLNDLLHTTDLSILLATLRLGLRPAQQFSAGGASQGSFGISEKRLINLAQGWATREYGLEMVDLAADELEIPAGLEEVEWTFYKKATAGAVPATGEKEELVGGEKKDKGKETDAMDVEDDSSKPEPSTSSTPAPKPRAAFAAGSLLATPIPATPTTHAISNAPAEGLTTVLLGNVRATSKAPVDLLVDAIETYEIPEPERLDLLQKIRIAKALGTAEERRTMLVIRLLAIAVFAHTSSESAAQTKLFLYEPELIPQLAELVHPDRKVPIEIQAAAFYALDALAKSKAKLSEVASSLNASVSHGILMYVVRRTVTDLEGDNPISTPDFIDSLFNILTYFHTSAFVGNMIVGAGIVPVLVDFVKNQRRDRIAVVTRAIIFLDGLMYGYSSAFTNFITAGGLAIFVDRTKDEIELCIAAHSYIASTSTAVIDAPTGLLSFEQAALLKALLRAIQRLMQTAGTTEGLRNLIDSSLLASVKSIMQHRVVFGPQLFALAINITATFVHNEPTCLTTIQEAQVPDALYDAIEDSVPPSIDVLQAIPNAIGALCLNPQGLAQFNNRPIIARYFAIFSSERHVRILAERDNGNMIGASIDELIRHHPSLKDQVLEAVIESLKVLREMGRAFVPPSNEGYGLQAVPVAKSETAASTGEGATDVVMQDAPAAAAVPAAKVDTDEGIMACIDVMGRFLEGLFQNISHCKDFVKLDPIPIILDLFSLPCTPATNPGTQAFSSLAALLRVISEVKATELVMAILKKIRLHLDETSALWSPLSIESRLAPLLTPTTETLDVENTKFRGLCGVLTYIALLSDVYGNLSYAHGKVATAILATLAVPEEKETIVQLGTLYRTCLWETIVLKKKAPTAVTGSETKEAGAAGAATPAVVGEPAVGGAGAAATPEGTAATPLAANTKAVDDLLTNIPLTIIPVFQAAIKLFVHRRSGDAAHRKASAEVSMSIATIMTENLRWPDSPDLAANLAYSTLMIKGTASLLFDERASLNGIQTLLIVAFEKTGGLEAFLSLYSRYQAIATNLLTSSDEKPELSQSVVHVFAGLKAALDLLQRLSSHRTLLESPQTAVLLTREKDKTSPDYFDPHSFLVGLRAAILPVVRTTWDVKWLRKAPPNVVRSIVGTLVNILRAEGETSTDPASVVGATPQFPTGSVIDRLMAGGGFLGGAGGGAGGGGAAPGPFVLDETRVIQLVDMGFPRTAASSALTRCRNNVGVATEYLLQHPDLVGAARVAEAEAESRAAVVAQAQADAPPAAAAAPAGAAPIEGAPAAALAAVEGAEPVPVAAVEGAANPVAEDVEMGEAVAAPTAADPPTPVVDAAREAANKAIKAELDAAREELKPTFLTKAISLAEDYADLVFDIKGAFSLLNTAGDKTAPSMQPLLDDLARLGEGDSISKDEQAIATRLRVIALLAADPAYRETIETGREQLMEALVRYQKIYAPQSPAPDARPKWLASAMLVADSLFSAAEVSRPSPILAEGEELPSLDLVSQGPSWESERRGFFDLAMDVLTKGVSDREVYISTLRLLLVLTRDHDLAVLFVQQDGLRLLFSSLTVERPETAGCRSYAVMILRHVVEDKTILRPIMEREIEGWFAQPRAKVADITGFLRGASSIAFRNVEVFLEATRSTCKLVQADAAGHYHVALLKEPQPQAKPFDPAFAALFGASGEPTTAPSTEIAVDEVAVAKSTKVASTAPTSSTMEASVHFLMSEILDSSKLALAPLPTPSTPSTATKELATPATPSAAPGAALPTPAAGSPASPRKADESLPADVPMGDFFHTSFAMSCLTELLASYSGCKSSFLTFSTRRPAKESSTSSTPHKHRSSFLHFLLSDLISVGSIVPPADFDSRRRASISTWASLVVVALCYDPETASAHKEPPAELTHVRKTVLDAIARAFKEATASTEPTDVRYSRLLALSDLCYRLLTSRPYPSISKPHDETSMQLAKLMLEKNFAVILTNALADVDLNFPSVNNLINSILRPMEQLTKVVTKVGRAKTSVPAAGRPEDDASTDASSFDEGEELEVDTEEDEAPDLYRNSALGMYEGELEPGHQEDAYMSSGSTEEYDEDDDLMDMEDGVIPGSDISDVSDDEHEHDHEMGDDDDEGDSEDDDDDSEGDGSSGDELEIEDDGDEDVLVDGIGQHGEGEEDEEVWIDDGEEGGDEGDEADEAGFLDQGSRPIGDEDLTDTDGEDMDDEGMYLEGGLEFDAEMTEQLAAQEQAAGFGWDSLGTGEGASGRRNRAIVEDMMQLNDATLFGRSRPLPATAAHTATHPLLVDTPTTESRQETPARRQRGGATRGTPEYDAWAQSIEEMIGAGAVEALQELLGSHGLGHLSGPDQIRVQVAQGPDGGQVMVIDPSPAAAAAQAHAAAQRTQVRGGEAVPAPRTARQLTDRINSTAEFLPITTVQRWQEEARITAGNVLAAERIARLVNHVINVLHPPARLVAQHAAQEAEHVEQNAKDAREVEEKRAEETRQEEAAAAAATAATAPESMEVESAPGAAPATTTATPAVGSQTVEDAAEAMEGVTMQDDLAEVMSLARSLAAGLAGFTGSSAATPTPATPVPAVQATAPEPQAAEDEHGMDDDDDELDEGEEGPEASGSGAQDRVTIFIHGNEVDITDTGIDPTFLEALPDDMREEVLNQHFRESRTAAPAPAVPSQINSEFLDALPPDLRAEVLRQEAAEQRREQAVARAAARGGGGEAEAAAGPADIEPADFLASLDPQLRQAVLLEQEDGFLSTLPANLVAEANDLRQQSNARRAARQAANPTPPVLPLATPAGGVAPKKPVHREAIQLLDKSGLATLVRLLFFPQPLRKNALQKVLANLCENSRTRTELINLLLTILQDGTRDVSAVDKSFSQMSLRASKHLGGPKDTPRRKVGAETPGGGLPHFPGESVPNLIAQRCLEALMFLVSSNDQAPLFFLTEQEVVVGLNRRSSKKGKGKEKATPSTTYPIIVLLSLLDRPALLKTQSMMDSLTQLLSTITKALAVLQKKTSDTEAAREAQTVAAPGEAPPPVAADPVAAAPATDAPSSTTPATTTATPATDAPATEPAKDAEKTEPTPGDILLKDPPHISPSILRLVVNILDAGECSSKTFQQTLVLIQNLSYLPEAREVISEELKARAQALSNQLLPDLDELLVAVQSTEDVRGVTLAKFSPASSLQAKLLRILKTIDWIHSPPKKTAPTDTTATTPKLSPEEEKVSLIYESFDFAGLWQRLGSCLAGVEQKPELLYIATVLLPLIESLMVVSKYVGKVHAPREALSPASPKEADLTSSESLFLAFTDEHKKILNTMVKNNPALLSGSFSILVHNPNVLEFENKRSFFFSRLHDRSQRQRQHYGTLQVNVRRQYVFEDSFHNLQRRTGEEIKNAKLNVKFYDEEGVDAGGVTREWFSVLARQMFNPGYALFQPQAADALTYQPNKSSAINPEHLSFFKFVGRIIGKALHDQRILEAYFSRSVYKHMLGKPVDHRDLESIDPEYHKSLVWMLENDIDGILDLTMSVERDDFGVTKIVDIIPDGRNVPVTNENKAEYVRLIADQRLSAEIKDQIGALLQGLYEIVPKDLLQIFSEKELELLISGLPEIDVDEWRANTDLHNFTATDPVIGYFWRAVRSFTLEERAKLLQFVSGSSRVPLEGFSSLQGMSGVTKFSITSAGATQSLPTAHTCFNQLDLPSSYTSYEALRKALLTAITEGAGGFGFA